MPWCNQDSKTALIKAASSGDTPGHIEAVRYLMQLGAQTNPQDPGALTNYQDPVSLQRCRHYLVLNLGKNIFTGVFHLLLQWGGHALYYACCFGYVGVIAALLASPDTGLNLRQGVCFLFSGSVLFRSLLQCTVTVYTIVL